ncbi:unnamed protein product, partial [Meganyctiphanes norvegica]
MANLIIVQIIITIVTGEPIGKSVDLKKLQHIRALEEKYIDIGIIINETSLTIFREQQTIYSGEHVLYTDGRNGAGGLVLVALHERNGDLMLSRRFRTYEPADHLNLAQTLRSLQPGRIVVIAGLPDFIQYLGPDGMSALNKLCISLLRYSALGEPWAAVAVQDPVSQNWRVLGEALATHYPEATTRNLAINVQVARKSNSESHCGWSRLHSHLSDQAAFCDDYEGYGELCHCTDTYVPSKAPKPARISMFDQMPLVIVTANKPYHLYRLVRNLDNVLGSKETPKLVVIDGLHEETFHLCRLLHLDIVVHRPQGTPKEVTRTNMAIRFALFTVFNHFPEARLAIVLEDDLLLSPDLLSFFHQTASVLQSDPSLYGVVNAFGQNSFPNTASDPTAVLRADMYPQYGWMATRAWAEEVLPLWVKEESGNDWDWLLFNEDVRKGRHVLVPEVSRTAHAGTAGQHVTGWEQLNYFNGRLHNLRPNVTLKNLDRLNTDKYADWFEREIRQASKIKLTDHPCHALPIYDNQTGPYVLYVGATGRDDHYNGYFLMQTCLGTDDQEVKETYEGVIRLRVRPYKHKPKGNGYSNNTDTQIVKHKVLYIVGCPLSKYCKYSSGTSDWIIPSAELLKEANRVSHQRRMRDVILTNRYRRMPHSPDEEFSCKNLID